MSKIWYCPNCGYEVSSRGRCHQCRQRLVASSLPELAADEDDDEVGYRLDGWVDRERGRLIERLNLFEIVHRFEEDELVVAAEDESRVDDLIAELAADPEEEGVADGDWGADGLRGEGMRTGGGEPRGVDEDEWVGAAVRLLADAAARLRRDPTDMHADADVAEASAAVFMADQFYGADAETWAAIGRVTRRLLSALGADEALEDEIRSQAAVLDKLLAPLARQVEAAASPAGEPALGPKSWGDGDADGGGGGDGDSAGALAPAAGADSMTEGPALAPEVDSVEGAAPAPEVEPVEGVSART